MSQAELGGENLSDSYVSLIESGRRRPTPQVIDILARRLDCSASYLITGLTDAHAEQLHTAVRYGQIALENGEAAEACDRFAQALADPGLATFPDLVDEARWGHARALEASGDLTRAISELRSIAETVTPDDDPDRWAHLHIALCRCLSERGDMTEAIQVGEAALQLLIDDTGLWRDTAVMLGATVLAAYYMRGDLIYARHFANTLIARAEANGSVRARMAAYWNASWVARLRGEPDGALILATRALGLLGELNDPRNLARLRTAYGHFLLTAHPDQARRVKDILLQAQREVADSSASTVDAARCLIRLAQTELILDHPAEAAGLATRAVELLTGTTGIPLADALTVLGDAYLRLGERDDAIAYLTRAVCHLEKMKADRQAAQTWYDIANILAAAGEQRAELTAIQHALTCVHL